MAQRRKQFFVLYIGFVNAGIRQRVFEVLMTFKKCPVCVYVGVCLYSSNCSLSRKLLGTGIRFVEDKKRVFCLFATNKPK